MPRQTEKNKHLNYRLWISEMNYYINVLRIFHDYLADHSTDTKKSSNHDAEHFKKSFLSLREEMDHLRHEMHLDKMKIAASLRNQTDAEDKNNTQEELKKTFLEFRKKFKKAQKDFQTWLN